MNSVVKKCVVPLVLVDNIVKESNNLWIFNFIIVGTLPMPEFLRRAANAVGMIHFVTTDFNR
jgi:hypothetical protein